MKHFGMPDTQEECGVRPGVNEALQRIELVSIKSRGFEMTSRPVSDQALVKCIAIHGAYSSAAFPSRFLGRVV